MQPLCHVVPVPHERHCVRPVQAGSPPVVQRHQDHPKGGLVEPVTDGILPRSIALFQPGVAVVPWTQTIRGEGARHPGPQHRLSDHPVVPEGQKAAGDLVVGGEEAGLHVKVVQGARVHVQGHGVAGGHGVHTFVQRVLHHRDDIFLVEAGGRVHPDGHFGVKDVGLHSLLSYQSLTPSKPVRLHQGEPRQGLTLGVLLD